MGKCITDVHWFVVVQCYTWRFICYTSSIICCCNGLSLPIVWLSARSGCCFPSYLHLTLSVFHQLIIPLRYLTINFGISLFSPYSASFAPSPLQGPSNFIHFQSGVDHQSLLFCLRAYILAALVHIMVGYGCLLRWLFFTFPILFASCLWSRQYSILDLIHSSIDIYFTLFHRACWRSTFIIDLQIVSSTVGV